MNGVGIVFLGFVSYGTLHIKVCYLVTSPPLMDYLLTSDCRHMALNHGSGMVQLIAWKIPLIGLQVDGHYWSDYSCNICRVLVRTDQMSSRSVRRSSQPGFVTPGSSSRTLLRPRTFWRQKKRFRLYSASRVIKLVSRISSGSASSKSLWLNQMSVSWCFLADSWRHSAIPRCGSWQLSLRLGMYQAILSLSSCSLCNSQEHCQLGIDYTARYPRRLLIVIYPSSWQTKGKSLLTNLALPPFKPLYWVAWMVWLRVCTAFSLYAALLSYS